MPRSDRDYLKARIARECDMAERATTVEAAVTHRQLAELYQARLLGAGGSAHQAKG